MKTIRQLKRELEMLTWVEGDQRVRDAKELVRKERQPKIDALTSQIKELQSKRPESKPRWPIDVPPHVLDICKKYWSGTTEDATFRIHCWNDKLVCTGYRSGGYSTVGGWTPTPACFIFLSLTDTDYGKPRRIGLDLEGRQSLKILTQTLTERSQNL